LLRINYHHSNQEVISNQHISLEAVKEFSHSFDSEWEKNSLTENFRVEINGIQQEKLSKVYQKSFMFCCDGKISAYSHHTIGFSELNLCCEFRTFSLAILMALYKSKWIHVVYLLKCTKKCKIVIAGSEFSI
jgi:hypothetical protein